MDENTNTPTPKPEDQKEQETPTPETPSPESAQTSPQPEPGTEPTQSTPPVNTELTKDAKMWAMFCHLSALAMFTSIPFANIIGPLIIWLIKKDDFAFVDDQGKEALNFQISLSIYSLVSAVTLCFPPLFIVIILALMITNLVFIIIASIAANNGQAYRYPLSLRLVK